MLWFVMIAAGFLAGGIMFGALIPKWVVGKDVCKLSDDGNPGAFNAIRHGGKAVGAACLVFDILKGFLPVFIARTFLDVNDFLFILVICAPVFGHATGLTNRFRGGKCISVSFGVLLGLIPVTYVVFYLAAIYVLFSTVIRIKSHRARSVVTYVVFAVVALAVLIIRGYVPLAVACACVSATVTLRHVLG